MVPAQLEMRSWERCADSPLSFLASTQDGSPVASWHVFFQAFDGGWHYHYPDIQLWDHTISRVVTWAGDLLGTSTIIR